jgi:hypothetical protein
MFVLGGEWQVENFNWPLTSTSDARGGETAIYKIFGAGLINGRICQEKK